MRRFGFLLFGFLAVWFIVGCSKTKTEQTSDQDSTADSSANIPAYVNLDGFPIQAQTIEPMTMMVAQLANQKAASELTYYMEMEKKTGVKWEYIQPPSSAFNEQRNLAFASGNLPDVIYNAGISTTDEFNWGSTGLLLPLEGLIATYAHNFRNRMKEYPDMVRSITSPDERIYSMPNINNSPREVTRLWINIEWAENFELCKYNDEGVYEWNLPNTVDGLYDLLVRFRDGDPNKNGKPDDIPMSFSSNFFGGHISVYSSSPSKVILSYFGIIGKGISLDNGKVFFSSVDPRYKEYLKFMNRLYAEKLLDNESFVQDTSQLAAKGMQNIIGITSGSNGIANNYNRIGDLDKLKSPSLPPMTSSVNDKLVYPIVSKWTPGTFVITKNCSYPEVAMRWIDVNYSDNYEDVLRAFWGGSWKWTDESKGIWEGVVPEGQGQNWRFENFTNNGANNSPFFWDTKTLDNQGGIIGRTDRYKYVDGGSRFSPYGVESMPVFGFVNTEREIIATTGNDIYTYADQMEAAFITGNLNIDSEWDNYVATLQRMGIDKLVSAYQSGYDRYISVK